MGRTPAVSEAAALSGHCAACARWFNIQTRRQTSRIDAIYLHCPVCGRHPDRPEDRDDPARPLSDPPAGQPPARPPAECWLG
jgi:hypothetical protein